MTIAQLFATQAQRTHESRILDWIEHQEDVQPAQLAESYNHISTRLSAMLQRMVTHSDNISARHKEIMHPYSASTKGQQAVQDELYRKQACKMADHKHLMGKIKDWSEQYAHKANALAPQTYTPQYASSIEPIAPV